MNNLEKIAAFQHEAWVHWSQSVISQYYAFPGSPDEFMIYLKEKWEKKWKAYEKLPEREKEKNRKWARRIIEVKS